MKVFLRILSLMGLCTLSESMDQSFCHPLEHRFLDNSIGGRLVFPNDWLYHPFLFVPLGTGSDEHVKKTPLDGAKVEVFGITFRINNHDSNVDRGADGVLKGWIHIKIDFSASTSELSKVGALIIQAEEYENQEISGIGQFVHDFPWDGCPDVQADIRSGMFVPPSPYQFVPCAGSSLYEPLPSNTFIFNRKSPKASTENTKESPIFHLFWRFSNYYCNQIKNIRFRVNVVPNNGFARINSGEFGKPTIIKISDSLLDGASDLMPSRDQIISCTAGFSAFLSFPWVKGVEEKNDGDFSSSSCNSLDDARPSFRCNSAPQGCQQGNMKGTVEEYARYIQNIADHFLGCPVIPKKTDMEPKILKVPLEPRSTTTTTSAPITLGYDPEQVHEFEEKDRVRGVFADRFPGSVVWNYRVFHGVIQIIGAMFITPVSNFMTRYYKETFMEKAIMFQRVWYWVHLISIPLNFSIHLFGGYAISTAKSILGSAQSSEAFAHRQVGWSAVIILILMTLLGGFRPVPFKLREVVITLHWLLGSVYHALCLTAVGNSVYIYGSPSAYSDMSNEILTLQQNPQYLQIFFFVWIVFYVGCHIAMTISTILHHERMGIKHVFLPVIIPMAEEDDLHDIPGSAFRKDMLAFFVGFSFIFTFTICLWMSVMDSEDRTFGFMSCTHNSSDHLILIQKTCKYDQ